MGGIGALLALAVILFFGGCHAQNGRFTLRVIHLNDTHSHLDPVATKVTIAGVPTRVEAGGYALLSRYIHAAREKPEAEGVLVLHAGDAVQGTLYYTLFGGEADADAMNRMAIDAMTLGNHAFDRGAEALAEDFLQRLEIPVVDANLETTPDSPLAGRYHAWLILERGGERIGLVGETVDATLLSRPGPTVRFADYLTSAAEAVAALEAEGIDKIVFLTHLGYETDRFLARQVRGIDLIVGGHSHTLLGDFGALGLASEGPYPTVERHDGEVTLVVTAWKWGMVIGDVTVTFDKEGRVVAWHGRPVMPVTGRFLQKGEEGLYRPLEGEALARVRNWIARTPSVAILSADPAVEAVIALYRPRVEAMMSEVVGEAAVPLVHVRLPGEKDPDTGETLGAGSLLAPLIARSMYEKVQEAGGCDFALLNAGGVRGSLPAGPVTLGEIYTILPFGNTLVRVTLPGATIVTMIREAVRRAYLEESDTGAFPYLDHARITIRRGPPLAVEVTVEGEEGLWHPLDPLRDYTLVVNAYLAGGGDGYTELKEASEKVDTGFVDAPAFLEYVRRASPLVPLSPPPVAVGE